jgi:hypothetical protein
MSEPVRGIIVRPEGAELVIRPASEADVRRFSRGQEVAFAASRRQAAPSRQGYDFWVKCMDLGGFLYDQDGNPVAVVDGISTHMDVLDTSTFGGVRSYMQGPRYITGTFRSF